VKKNLGKILLYLLLGDMLFANNLATYTLTANKKTTHIKEAVILTFTATQTHYEDAMFFFLQPHKSKHYTLTLLEKKTTETQHHHTQTVFKYILFATKATTLHIGFDFIIKTASDKAVAQIYTGGRDNVKWIETHDTTIALKPLLIQVLPLQHDVDLVGDFNLTCKLDKYNLTPYETTNFSCLLEGQGYKPTNLSFVEKSPNITLFQEQTTLQEKLTQEGYLIKKAYMYALSSTQNFTIKTKTISLYSPTKNRYYKLQPPSYTIRVTPIKPSTILDTTTIPQPQKELISFDLIEKLLTAIVIFLSGYFTAKIQKKHSFKIKKTEKKYKDIQQARTPKELLFILLHNYQEKKLTIFIQKLEIYSYTKKSKKGFENLKTELIKALKKSET